MAERQPASPPRAKRAPPRRRGTIAANQKLLALTVVAVTTVALAVVYFVYDIYARVPSCDQLFEQTAARFDGKLKLTEKISVAFALGRQGVQKIDDGNQKVAVHLKNCCISRQLRAISESRFQRCVDGARQYEEHIVKLVAASKQAKAANDRRDLQAAAERAATARQAADNADTDQVELGAVASNPQPSAKLAEGSEAAEQEPNDTILQANPVSVGQIISGEIAKGDDVDFFKFHYDGVLRDRIEIKLENQSSALQPALTQYSAAKAQAGGLHYDNTPGADVHWTISVDPGTDFYIAVSGRGSIGAYKLSTLPLKAYDSYEPNDDAFHATPISPGQKLEANIMDEADVDYYRVDGAIGKKAIVHIENASSTLGPKVEVFNAAKQELTSTYNNTPGADLDLAFDSELGKPFYVRVSGNGSAGAYGIVVDQQ